MNASQDQFLYVTGSFNNSGVITKEVWPSYDMEVLIYKFFGKKLSLHNFVDGVPPKLVET